MPQVNYALVLRCFALLLASTLCAAPAAAREADDPRCCTWPMVGERAFDVVVLRPFGAAQLILGSAFFVVIGPLSWPGGGFDEALDMFVQAPFDNTFTRKLGDF
jgi:hypothetical protein